MKIWMKVTQDKYQLPLIIAESCKELANLCGKKEQTIRSTMSHYRKGRIQYPSYVCVKVEEGDQDD